MNRTIRDEARGRAAYAKARSAGASAVTAALAQISATFGPAWVANRRKLAVEQIIRMGAADPEVQARYGARVRASGASTLADALADAELWRAAELRRPSRAGCRSRCWPSCGWSCGCCGFAGLLGPIR
ncbi:MAG: hypothetical protein JWP25_9010 [Bradyrhizobium sp.]|nr:hypothetical protein [Bradyrhizobium sp.]